MKYGSQIRSKELQDLPEDDENLRKRGIIGHHQQELDEQGQMAHKPARMLTPKFILKGSLCAKLSYLPPLYLEKTVPHNLQSQMEPLRKNPKLENLSSPHLC